MTVLPKRVNRSGVAATTLLHLALGASLLHFDDVQSAAQTTVMVSVVDSAGEARTSDRPKPLPKKVPKPQPPLSASPHATETSVPTTTQSSAPEAMESAVVLPQFNADYLNNPKPAYPLVSRRMGEQGRAIVRVQVRADGTPAEVTLDRSSGSARLDQAALDAVRKWRFVPARRGDTAIAAPVLVPVSFTLES